MYVCVGVSVCEGGAGGGGGGGAGGANVMGSLFDVDVCHMALCNKSC